MLHFAYASNMDRAVMRRHAPSAEPIGVAWLPHHRFIVTVDGYASVLPVRAQNVYGVLWRLAPRDRVGLDRWEGVACGQYRAEMLHVQGKSGRRPALVYVALPRRAGRPRPGYMELVLAAAAAWSLPTGYITALREWLPAQPLGAGLRSLKEFGWT
jgi:AIG2-like family